jgi:hypothetical protein
MARYWVYPRGHLTNEVNTQATGRSYTQAIRDELRTLLPSPRFRVSDIAQWTSALTTGFGFIIRDTATTSEWFLAFAAFRTTGTANIYELISGGSANYANFFRTTANVSTGTTPNDGWAVWYNPDWTASSWSMGFNNTTNLTYNAGDFQTPAVIPSSIANATSFFPTTRWPLGIFFQEMGVSVSQRVLWSFVIDDVEEAILFYVCQTQQRNIDAVVLSGRIYDVADGSTNDYGNHFFRLNYAAGLLGTTIHNIGFSFDVNNLNREYNALETQDITYNNQLNVNDDFRWREVVINHPTVASKGKFKRELVLEVGAYNDPAAHMSIFNSFGGPKIKAHASFAFAYVPQLPFPYAKKRD